MAILAHDMRNPLSALLTNIHFVKSVARGGSSDVDEALSDSALSCSILGQLIGNLEVLGRAFGASRLAPVPVNTRDVVGQAVARAAPGAKLAGIEVTITKGSPGATVLVDALFFGRVLDNLLANSLQYSPANGKVTIELVTAGERGGVRLIDQGPIVPPEFRERVLTAEGQASAKSRYEARYGRGLAFYCAAQAASIAGAELSIGEQDGHFLVELWGPIAR